MNISSSLMFFLPGSNAYTLKVLAPDGFQATGGDFSEFVTGELTYPANSLATYHFRGYFTTAQDATCFRVLRSNAQANSQSLFVEKARLCVSTNAPQPVAAGSRKPAPTGPPQVVYVNDVSSNYQGYLDEANCTIARGWAWDASNGAASVTVELLANGNPVAGAEAVADQYRSDLAAFGIGNGNHAYSISIPNALLNNQNYAITVRIKNTNYILNNQYPIQCSGGNTPPPSGGQCASSINAVNYGWDGGNNSITIRVNTAVGSPQVMWTGPSSVGWATTFENGTNNWQYAQVGMAPGTYTASVRPQGDGGVGCSFSFSVPSAGGQLYPNGCSNPPAAPAISAANGTQVCDNTPTVTLTASNCTGGTIQWSNNATGSQIQVGAGTYSARCSVNSCSSGPSNQITVTSCTTPPPSGGQCASSINAVNYGWDGGNNSITIRVNTAVGSPQVMWTGPSSVGWATTFENGTNNWQYAQVGMAPGTYTASVRPQGDGG